MPICQQFSPSPDVQTDLELRLGVNSSRGFDPVARGSSPAGFSLLSRWRCWARAVFGNLPPASKHSVSGDSFEDLPGLFALVLGLLLLLGVFA